MEVFVALELISFWICLALLTGIFARVRCRRSGLGWFVLALLIGPLFAFALVAILGKKEKPDRIYVTQ